MRRAPTIFLAVVRIAMPYSQWLYLPLALLHLSLAARVTDDFSGLKLARLSGSAGSALAIAVFIAAAATQALRKK